VREKTINQAIICFIKALRLYIQSRSIKNTIFFIYAKATAEIIIISDAIN